MSEYRKIILELSEYRVQKNNIGAVSVQNKNTIHHLHVNAQLPVCWVVIVSVPLTVCSTVGLPVALRRAAVAAAAVAASAVAATAGVVFGSVWLVCGRSGAPGGLGSPTSSHSSTAHQHYLYSHNMGKSYLKDS